MSHFNFTHFDLEHASELCMNTAKNASLSIHSTPATISSVLDSSFDDAARSLRTRPAPVPIAARAISGEEQSFDATELYFRQLGHRSLLTREGEVELARRIEDGERAVLRAFMRSPVALRELAAVGADIRDKRLRQRDVLRDVDEDLADKERVAQMIAALHRAGMLAKDIEQRKASRANAQAVLAELSRLRLHRRVLDRVVDAVRTALSEATSPEIERESRKTLAAIERGRRIADRAKTELVEANLRLVVLFAKRHKTQGLPLLDLIQEGNIGLMRAADKFDHRRGIRFSTYAAWWVKQQMTRAIADQGKTIRIPVHMVESRRKLTRARRRFEAEYGREPDEHELTEHTGILLEKVQAVGEILPQPISLHAPSGAEGEATVGDFVPDKTTPAPDEQIARSKMRVQTRALLETLTPREQQVLFMRFGLGGTEEHTLQEIGTSMSLSRERVRQIEATALRKLRDPSVRGELQSYLVS